MPIHTTQHRNSSIILMLAILVFPAPVVFAQQNELPENENETEMIPLFIEDAHDLRMEGHYDRAVELYIKLATDPVDSFEANLGLARCSIEVGQYDQALSTLTQIQTGNSAEHLFLLTQLYDRLGRYDDVLKFTKQAIKLDPNHAGARRLHARTLERLGKKHEAVEAYRWFDQQILKQHLKPDAEWITETAKGFLRYSILTQTNVRDRTRHVLQEMLQMAYSRLDRGYWPARIAAADLLRERYNNDKEDGSVSDYLAALRINEHLPEAHVGLGEIALEKWGFEEIEKRVKFALHSNPSFSPAFHLLAKKLIIERRYDQAIETCKQALSINPNDIIALSLQAAAGACLYDQKHVDQLRQRVAEITPKCALFHQIMGNALSGIRQYAASEKAFFKAIEIDPTNANARTELGMMYMQWGWEDKARDALDAAWVLDPYNQRTKFTLELLDMLENFTRYETEHFIVKYNDQRDPGLGEYIAGYLEDIYKEVTGDFNTKLKEKTIIEFFPTHRAFGVRITGKPWIHTVGASTGMVIAMDSPRASKTMMGVYNIASVLKHEFTHTVTLAATQNRIPHWFTEGLAVYQEDTPRQYPWCNMLAHALRHNELFTLESIDWGFMRPRKPNDRQKAYAQSEWMTEFIIDRFGYDKILVMLDRYREGQNQKQVIEKELHLSVEEFDQAFREWAKVQVVRWGYDITPPEDISTAKEMLALDPDNPTLQGRLARAELDHNDYEHAIVSARIALELDENEPNSLFVIAHILYDIVSETKDKEKKLKYDHEALPYLKKLLTLDPNNRMVPKYLAEIAMRREQWDRAIEMLQQLQRLHPIDPTSWSGLAGIYLKQGEDQLAMTQLLELARLNDADVDVAAKLGRMFRRQENWSDAIIWFRRALVIDPFDVTLHEVLGDTCMQSSDTPCALREYLMLTRLEPDQADHFSAAARAAHKLGDKKKTQFLARRAVELDPNSDVKSLIP